MVCYDQVTTSRIGTFIKIVACACSLVLGACTWVKLDEAGKSVEVLGLNQVNACERLGTTTSKGVDKVGFYDRNSEKVAIELETLARNEAARMGGNVIVKQNQSVGTADRELYVVYLCKAGAAG